MTRSRALRAARALGAGRVALRALGIRDVILGAIALHTADHPEVGPRWQRTLAVADAVDFAATLAARPSLPRRGSALVLARRRRARPAAPCSAVPSRAPEHQSRGAQRRVVPPGSSGCERQQVTAGLRMYPWWWSGFY